MEVLEKRKEREDEKIMKAENGKEDYVSKPHFLTVGSAWPAQDQLLPFSTFRSNQTSTSIKLPRLKCLPGASPRPNFFFFFLM